MSPSEEQLKSIERRWSSIGSVRTLENIAHKDQTFPILEFRIGSTTPSDPALMITGGVHGLERIGTDVALSFMETLIGRWEWDRSLRHTLDQIQLIVIPLVNPVGHAQFTRSNGNGVDLMRNAPVTAKQASFAVGGHHWSRRLPWYRGNPEQTEAGMEPESRALVNSVRGVLKEASFTLALDLHSGFGIQDQIWYPYAFSQDPLPSIDQVKIFEDLLRKALPYHAYKVEPQSLHYTTHGDLWDFLYLGHERKNFLPLTLEMGSWSWVRKNPFQLFSLLGPFNPIKLHRHRRTLRRHLPLFQFLMSLTGSPACMPETDRQKSQ